MLTPDNKKHKQESCIRQVTVTVVCGFLALQLLTGCLQGKREDIQRLTRAVEKMDTCRQRSQNRNFYLYKYEADKIIGKYAESYTSLPNEEQQQYIRARLDYAFALTDYYQQVGMPIEARGVMNELASDASINLVADTVHWLNFLCHEGTAYYHPYNVKKYKDDILKGYDCLAQCYFLSQREGLEKYKAISMMLLSQYLGNTEANKLIREFDPAFLRYINEDGVELSLLAGNLAERALSIFITQDDYYYEAAGWLTLADCFFNIGNGQMSIECLQNALKCKQIKQTPNLLASVHEQLSMSYASMNQKQLSDHHRNKYLDLQDSTRQDKSLEARVEALNQSTDKIWGLVGILFIVFLALGGITILLVRLRKKNAQRLSRSEEEADELEEQIAMLKLKQSQLQRSAVDQRARIQMANSMVPLIDRMCLAADTSPEYVAELAELVDNQNVMLTRWIKLEKGSIQPKIETLRISDITRMLGKERRHDGDRKITISVQPTDVVVKADRALTLFLINTLVDNASGALPLGGTVEIVTTPHPEEGYAEIAVKDNGKGIPADKLAHLFEYKTIQDSDSETTTDGAPVALGRHKSHGFGLQNCRGIIDSYRKLSSIFSVCDIKAESTVGEGTTIRFRLPLVVRSILLAAVCMVATPTQGHNAGHGAAGLAARYCDSLYYCNITGRYAQALLYSDSCKAYVTARTDTTLLLSLYNETAVAAMAMQQWEKYQYNNYLYTRLFKECTRDSSIGTYCQTMERNNLIAGVAVLVILLFILALIPVFWFVYLRPLLAFKGNMALRKRQLKEQIALLEKDCDRLHVVGNITSNQLSTLKHETMYYPSRIMQLLRSGEGTSQLHDTLSLYRDLYVTLCTRAISSQQAALSFPVRGMELTSLFDLDTDVKVLANRELMSYLKVLLKRTNGGRMPEAEICQNAEELASGAYVSLRFVMARVSPDLFSASKPSVDALVMRQIMRETGEAAHAYASGIRTETNDGKTNIIVTLPLCLRS